MVDKVDSPVVGSALRKFIADRVKEQEGWASLDGFLKQVSDIDAHLTAMRGETERLAVESAVARDQVKAYRAEGEQVIADAGAEAERIKQKAQDALDAAEAKKAEAADILDGARAEARRIISDARAEVQAALSRFKGVS